MTKPCKMCGRPLPILSNSTKLYCSECKRKRQADHMKKYTIRQRTRRQKYRNARPALSQGTVRALEKVDATREALNIEIEKTKKLLAGEEYRFIDKKYSIEKRMDI